MGKTYKFFKPNYYTGKPPEGSYRSIFKWGDHDKSEVLDEFLFIHLKQKYSLMNEDFTRQKLGLEQVEDVPKTINKEKQQKFIKTFGEKVSFSDYDRVAAAYGRTAKEIAKMRAGMPDNLPIAVIFPEEEEDILQAIEFAKANEYEYCVRGGGTNTLKNIGSAGKIVLDLRKFNRVLRFNEPDQLITVQAGIKGAVLERILNNAPENFDVNRRYTTGFFPVELENSTVGGWVAMRAGSAGVASYGRIQDIVYNLRIIRPDGTIVDTQEYAGSPDELVKKNEFFGHGQKEGIISSITLKFFRRVIHNDSKYCIIFKTIGQAEQAGRDIVQAQMAAPSELIISDAEESSFLFDSKGVKNSPLNVYFNIRDIKHGSACVMIAKATGTRSEVKSVKKSIMRAKYRYGGVNLTGLFASFFDKDRLSDPYIRETLMDFGFVTDFVDQALPYSQLPTKREQVAELAKKHPKVMCMSAITNFETVCATLRVTFLCQYQDPKIHSEFLAELRELLAK